MLLIMENVSLKLANPLTLLSQLTTRAKLLALVLLLLRLRLLRPVPLLMVIRQNAFNRSICLAQAQTLLALKLKLKQVYALLKIVIQLDLLLTSDHALLELANHLTLLLQVTTRAMLDASHPKALFLSPWLSSPSWLFFSERNPFLNQNISVCEGFIFMNFFEYDILF